MKKSEVRDAVYRELAPFLPGWKLVKKDEAFVRAIAGGTQKVLVPLIDYNPEFRFSLVLATRLDAVEALFNQFSGAPATAKGTTLTAMTQLAYFFPGEAKKQYSVRTEADIHAAAAELGALLSTMILPFLDQHADLAALDRAMNGADPQFDTSDLTSRTMHALVVARLASNPRFEELATTYQNAMQAFPEMSKQKVAGLVQHLRTMQA